MARIFAAFRNRTLRIGGRPALVQDGEPNEYKLKEDGCWIAVGQLSVHIIKTDEGVVVDVYGLHRAVQRRFLFGLARSGRRSV